MVIRLASEISQAARRANDIRAMNNEDVIRSVLPHDVIYMIIEQLHDDKPFLSALSLVCKPFFKHARSILFFNVTFSFPTHAGSLQDLLDFLKSTSHAPQYIHHLIIDGGAREGSLEQSIHGGELQMLGLTTSLQSLRLRRVRIQSGFGSITDMPGPSFPTLQDLTLQELYNGDNPAMLSVGHITSLLSHCPSLSTLTIGGLSLQLEPDSSQTHEGIPALKISKLRLFSLYQFEYPPSSIRSRISLARGNFLGIRRHFHRAGFSKRQEPSTWRRNFPVGLGCKHAPLLYAF